MRPPCHIASLWSNALALHRLLTPRTVLSNKKSGRDFYVTQQSFSASYRRRLDARSLRRDSQPGPRSSNNPADAVPKQWAAIKAIQKRLPKSASADGRPGYASTKQISRERSPGKPLHNPPTACHSNGRPAFGKRQWRFSPIPQRLRTSLSTSRSSPLIWAITSILVVSEKNVRMTPPCNYCPDDHPNAHHRPWFLEKQNWPTEMSDDASPYASHALNAFEDSAAIAGQKTAKR